MSTKLEQLLDLIINEETEKANELFHAIIVETSKEIYENLIAEEDDEEEMDEAKESDEEEMDEAKEEDDEEMDEEMDLEDSYSMEEEEPSFDTTDDDATGELGQEVDAFGDEEDGEEHGEESDEDQAIFDIKNAIAELEAAFAELEQAQDHEEHGEEEFGDEEGEEMGDEDKGMMMGMHEGRRMTREYREMVKDGHGAEKKGAAEGGIAGANTGEKMPSGTNTRSTYNQKADSEKPTSGARPISSKDGSVGANTGTTPQGKAGGLAGSVKGEFTKGVEKNISSSAKSSMKDGAALSKQGSGYPGNNKTAGPVGSGSGDKAGQTSVSSDKPFLKHL
jgi:hypothetical protein